jgi:ubiquinone/menaquinone biosynthesis C-methylase UbiE
MTSPQWRGAPRSGILSTMSDLRRLLTRFLPHRRLGEAAAARLAGSELVLAAGCGTELAVAIKAARPGCGVAGVDPDPRALRSSRRKADRLGLTVELRAADARRLPFRGPSFDAAVVGLLLQGFGAEETRSALRETARVLLPGGRLLALDFRGDGLAPLIAESGFSKPEEVWSLGPVRMLEARLARTRPEMA